ncbi:unnamed protein product, partial [Mesorhabditis belari]|uniref:Domain of unknown function DB domain-containing protein n=1 Tax=Mesorhabditis belari TaxID=2138241 RepID=A0AAF3FRX3_9BILA
MACAAFLLIFTVLVILPNLSENCASNGVCGGYGGCPPPPQPSSCSCPGSYGCGRFGCYRTRARGSKLFVPHRSRSRISKLEADREILRKKLQEKTQSGSDNLLSEISETAAAIQRSSHGQPFNPNRAFMECCLDRKLPDACLQKCNFNSYNKDALTKMYFKQDACPLAAMSEIQFCAAMGRDHTECCARNGVTTTLAGSKCLLFCDQKPGRVTPLDLSYVPCFDRFESMKSCFWHELSTFYRIR